MTRGSHRAYATHAGGNSRERGGAAARAERGRCYWILSLTSWQGQPPTWKLVRALAAATILVIPLRVVGLGFLPPDDALAQAARAVSGRPWTEVLVLRPDLALAPFPSWHGWHALLRSIHLLTGADALALVLFSVIALFVLMCAAPVVLLRRPEAWLLSLLVLAVADPFLVVRFFLGRPLMVAMAGLVTLCLTWRRLQPAAPDRPYLAVVAVLMTASAWFHGAWYLFLLLVAAFLIAREWRAARRLAWMLAVGAVAGSVLSGHPLALPYETLHHVVTTMNRPIGAMAVELQPFAGAPTMVVAVLGMLAWRALRGAWDVAAIDNPVFILMVMSWTLGWVAIRFYMDWAAPAALVWMAGEFQEAFEQRPSTSRGQLALAGAAALACYLAITSDVGPGRWSRSIEHIFLSADNPAHRPCLPDAGGILYSSEMETFYRTYFRNPTAPWRYMLGFEPAMMPPEDEATYNRIRLGTPPEVAYMPWVRKMRAADRLIVRVSAREPPPIAELEWYQPLYSVWCGRTAAR